MLKSYFVYALQDPRDESIRYVGMTKTPRNRFYQHVYGAKKSAHRMPTSSWIADLLTLDMKPNLIILEEYRTDRISWVREVEAQWIAHYKAAGAPLLNRQYARTCRRYSRILPGREPQLIINDQDQYEYIYY